MKDQEPFYKYNSKGDVVLSDAGKKVAFNRTSKNSFRSFEFFKNDVSVAEIVEAKVQIVDEEELEGNTYIKSYVSYDEDEGLELHCAFKRSDINFLKNVKRQEDALLNWELHKLLLAKKESESGK